MLDHMPEQYPIPGHRLRPAVVLDATESRGGTGDQRTAARRRALPHLLHHDRARLGDAPRVLRTRPHAGQGRPVPPASTRVAVPSFPRARRRGGGSGIDTRRVGAVPSAPRHLRRRRSSQPHSDTDAHEAALIRVAGVAGLWTFGSGGQHRRSPVAAGRRAHHGGLARRGTQCGRRRARADRTVTPRVSPSGARSRRSRRGNGRGSTRPSEPPGRRCRMQAEWNASGSGGAPRGRRDRAVRRVRWRR